MKENKTILKIIGGCAVILGGILFVKAVRKSYKELVAREKANNKLLEEAGLTPDDMEPVKETITNEGGPGEELPEKSFMKQLYEGVRFDSDLDLDCINHDLIYSDHKERGVSERVVHLRQTFNKKTKREELEFLFEIPFSAYGLGRSFSSTAPNIPDFLNSLLGEKKSKKVMNQATGEEFDVVKRAGGFASEMKNTFIVTPDPFTQLEGYYFLTFDRKDREPDDPRYSAMIKITKDFYQDYAAEGNNGLSSYIADVRKEMIDKDGPYELECESPQIQNAHIEDIILVQKISFPIATEQHPDGVTVKTVIKCMEKILDELKIVGTKGGRFSYSYFLMYDPDDDQDLCCFNTEPTKDGKVRVVSEAVF